MKIEALKTQKMHFGKICGPSSIPKAPKWFDCSVSRTLQGCPHFYCLRAQSNPATRVRAQIYYKCLFLPARELG